MPQSNRQQALESVLRNASVWRAEQVARDAPAGISTTHSALDQALPDAGWPLGALTELLCEQTGIGELFLLLPALRALCADGRGIALIAPPHPPFARAWEAAGIDLERLFVVDADGKALLWAAEQTLRSGECGAVLVWGQGAGRALTHRALQRLHLAAGTGHAACFLYRAANAQTLPSPAPLRLRLAAHAGLLQAHIVKCRGIPRHGPIPLPLFPAHWDAPPVRRIPQPPPVATPPRLLAAPAPAKLA